MAIAYYQKYRPIQLSDLIGQERTIEAITKQAEQDQFSHAYLLAGHFGAGKTTIARILATLLTCEKRIGASVCGLCDSCKAIHEGQCVDVVELDAATNGGVEDARVLKGDAYYAPQQLKKKVFIIDEAHMLSVAAWNALLKVIEEPPSFVAFIFCTTETAKVPKTILSRCQRYLFTSVVVSALVRRLQQVAKVEKLILSEPAAFDLARMANGSVRDALSMLQSVSLLSGGQVTEKTIRDHFGLPEKQIVYELASIVADRNAAAIIETVSELLLAGVDVRSIVQELSEVFRNAMVVDACGKDSKLIEASESEKEILSQLANKFGRSGLLHVAASLARIDQEIALNINARWTLEAALIRCILYGHNEVAKTK